MSPSKVMNDDHLTTRIILPSKNVWEKVSSFSFGLNDDFRAEIDANLGYSSRWLLSIKSTSHHLLFFFSSWIIQRNFLLVIDRQMKFSSFLPLPSVCLWSSLGKYSLLGGISHLKTTTLHSLLSIPRIIKGRRNLIFYFLDVFVDLSAKCEKTSWKTVFPIQLPFLCYLAFWMLLTQTLIDRRFLSTLLSVADDVSMEVEKEI